MTPKAHENAIWNSEGAFKGHPEHLSVDLCRFFMDSTLPREADFSYFVPFSGVGTREKTRLEAQPSFGMTQAWQIWWAERKRRKPKSQTQRPVRKKGFASPGFRSLAPAPAPNARGTNPRAKTGPAQGPRGPSSWQPWSQILPWY